MFASYIHHNLGWTAFMEYCEKLDVKIKSEIKFYLFEGLQEKCQPFKAEMYFLKKTFVGMSPETI